MDSSVIENSRGLSCTHIAQKTTGKHILHLWRNGKIVWRIGTCWEKINSHPYLVSYTKIYNKLSNIQMFKKQTQGVLEQIWRNVKQYAPEWEAMKHDGKSRKHKGEEFCTGHGNS